MTTLPRALVGTLLASFASAQLPALVVTDATTDSVWSCVDVNLDGDFNDAGEVTAVYVDTLGSVPFQNNIGLRGGIDGELLVTDSGEDSVFLLRDYNGDGDAHDDGENVRWFDGRAGGNPGGILLPAANGLIRQASSGAWFVACANSGTTGVDSIVRLIDLNFDGDANDLGEATEYWTAPGSPGGDSVPQAVEIGLDGNVYLLDAPSTGTNGKGVYRLVDVNLDGDAKDAGEVNTFFVPTFVATPFFWCLELAADGWFYSADTGNEVVWRFRDLNADGDASDAGESAPFWTVGVASNIWDLAAAADGSIYVSDSQGSSRILRLFDTDANGSIGAGEFTEIYNETLAGAVIGNGRGIDMRRNAAAGSGFCFGDGTATACPCGNVGTAGKGCANSLFPSGARLETWGIASVASDTLVLVGSRMPNSSALYFQGTGMTGGGSGTVFGDGLRCAGGAVIRLGTKVNAAGSSHYPVIGDTSVSVRGVVLAGDFRTYQIWYRNADPLFCAPNTFNLSNGVSLTWGP